MSATSVEQEERQALGAVDETDFADAPIRLWVSGANGLHYPADWHPKTRRLFVRPEGDQESEELQKSLGWDLGDFARATLGATSACWLPLCKNVDIVKLPPGVHLSSEEMKNMRLTWITAHPNGPGTDPAVPLIVHDNGDHYVVVGGAGGKLNQTTLTKSGEKKDLKAQKKQLKSDQEEELQKNQPEAYQKLQEAKQLYKAKSKEALAEHTGKALEMLGGSMDNLKAEARKQAIAKAKETTPDASPEEVEKFAAAAEKAAEGQAQKAVESALSTALDAVAKAEINQEALQATDLEALVGGKKLVKTLTPEEIQGLVSSAANLDQLKAAEAAVKKSLKTGNTDAAKGLKAFIDAGQPTDGEIAQWAKQGYLQKEAIKRQVALVQESEQAGKGAQERDQALGASDALNAYAAMTTGSAILDPETVKYLGVQNAARVLAAHLQAQGHNSQDLAQKLGQKISDKVDLHVAAALKLTGEMDALAENALKAAEGGDGTVTYAQALIVQENQNQRKWELLNLVRGQVQAASSLYWQLSHPSSKELVLKGGGTEIATEARAKSLGLEKGDYEREAIAGGFQLRVKPEAIAKMAQPVSPQQAERGQQIAQIKKEAEAGGAGSWKPSEGWNDGSQEPGADGKAWKVDLAPHQIAAVRAVVEHGKMVLSHGAGSGKTAVAYAIGAELLNTGKCKRGLISMPAKPRSQQEDYTEKNADGTSNQKTGEKSKFLQPEMAKRFTVVKSSQHLEKLLKENADRVLIMSPELMRVHAEGLLKQHGFGGSDSFLFADEAHELAIGSGEEGSGKAHAARTLAAGCGHVALGSGTLLENDASEVHSALSLVAPDVFPESGKKAFGERWKRQSMQSNAVLGDEQLGALHGQLGGYMLHYHQPPTGSNGNPVSLTHHKETLPLTEPQKALIVKANEQRALDEKSQDPNMRAAAALKWAGAVQRASIGPPMFDKITADVAAGRKKDPNYKAVIWSQELLPIKELTDRLSGHGKVVAITGSNSDLETKKAVDHFQNDPDVIAVVVSNAANFGVNLQAGATVLKCGFPPVPSKDEQLDARIFRRGQDKDVSTTTYLSDHPMVQAAYDQVHKVKGKAMELLSSLADDSLLSDILASYPTPKPSGQGQGQQAAQAAQKSATVKKAVALCLAWELSLLEAGSAVWN